MEAPGLKMVSIKLDIPERQHKSGASNSVKDDDIIGRWVSGAIPMAWALGSPKIDRLAMSCTFTSYSQSANSIVSSPYDIGDKDP